MASGGTITCPRCGGGDFRRSRWLSHGERAGHPGMHPCRCNACKHRFMARETPQPRGLATRWRAVGFGMLLILGVVFAVVRMVTPSKAPRSFASPQEWGEPAFDTGSDSARQALAEMPRDKRELDELIARLEQAAARGDTAAMTRLGVMHKYGVGILQNYQLAATWIRSSAEGGSPDGMLELGRLYRDGVGMERDPILAYAWFNRAAADLNMRAVKERDALMRTLTAEQLRAAQALSAADEQEFVADSVASGELKARSNP